MIKSVLVYRLGLMIFIGNIFRFPASFTHDNSMSLDKDIAGLFGKTD